MPPCNKSGDGKTAIQTHVMDDIPFKNGFFQSAKFTRRATNQQNSPGLDGPAEVLIADKRWKLLGFHQQQGGGNQAKWGVQYTKTEMSFSLSADSPSIQHPPQAPAPHCF